MSITKCDEHGCVYLVREDISRIDDAQKAVNEMMGDGVVPVFRLTKRKSKCGACGRLLSPGTASYTLSTYEEDGRYLRLCVECWDEVGR